MMLAEHLLCRGTDVHVANLEFGASLIPATNSHRTRNVAHVAEGFSRVHPGAAEFTEINRRKLRFATLVDYPSCEIRRLNPPRYCDGSCKKCKFSHIVPLSQKYI